MQRIREDRDSFFKADPVFALIGEVLALIPCE
jgi:hypothetical protein